MAIVTTDDKHYRNIADAIREKTGEVTAYKPEEIPAGIGKVHKAGYAEGHTDGLSDGYTVGYNDGIDQGKASEYDRFWNAFQNNGKRTGYGRAFYGEGWNETSYTPKYDMQPTDANQMYASSNISGIEVTTVDFSKATAGDYMLYNCPKLTRLPTISVVSLAGLNNTFSWDGALHTIDKLVLKSDGTQTFTTTFQSCGALTNLIIEGTIGNNGFNVSGSTKLTHESLMSIINALQDKTSVGGTWSVTLGATNLAKLTDAEKAIATQKGWTLA